MSIKLTNHLEGNFYQHKEFVLEQLASSTGLPAIQGILYTNTADKGFYYFDGTNWKRIDNQSMTASAILTALSTVDGAGSGLDADLLDNQDSTYYLNRANHNGNVPVANITDLATTVQGYRLDQFAIPTADINLNNRKITNLANPASATSSDAAPASWVTTAINNAVQGLDVKQSVVFASTSDIPLAQDSSDATNNTFNVTSGTLTNYFDGTISGGQRLLVKNQTNKAQNGIYESVGINKLKRVDLLFGESINPNVFVFVQSGSTLADTGWVLTTPSSNSNGGVGFDDIEWTQFSSAGIITAKANGGIIKEGNEISVDTAIVARKFSTSIGNASSTTFPITHSLGTEDVYVSVREASGDKEFVLADVAVTGTNTVSVTFADPPSTNQYRVTVIG